MERKPKFKQGLYPIYSSWLYKFFSFRAQKYARKHSIPEDHTHILANVFWEEYIQKKLAKEAKHFGCKELLIPAPITQNNAQTGVQKTAFILGCGSSINDVSNNEWQCIKQHYSVGLNLFFVHEFVPSVHFTEFKNTPKFIEFFEKRALKHQPFKETPLLISARYIAQSAVEYLEFASRKQVAFYPTVSVKTKDPELLSSLIPYFYRRANILTHHMSNLDSAINYCVTMGYNDIRLVGVDLYDEAYFYQSHQDNISKQAQAVLHEINANGTHRNVSRTAHATASKEISSQLGNLPITEYLPWLQQNVLNRQNIQLSVVNPKSLLASVLPTRGILQ
ncbi:hypothetical protein [Catenovulum sediminis]|uniref:hypothetical protein n=1 Tax=Catenovulum sediminis TaxID=1740262 RepID=UPI00117D6FB9|nr:hypothetical protein [Catenovulum sediminis]